MEFTYELACCTGQEEWVIYATDPNDPDEVVVFAVTPKKENAKMIVDALIQCHK